MKTLEIQQAFQYMTNNLRAGKSPTDRLQAKSGKGGWIDVPEDVYVSEMASGDFEFRIAPRTHTLNGYDVPAPETEAPAMDAEYWFIAPWADKGVYCDKWNGCGGCKNTLRNGLWLSKEDAVANAKAFRGEDPYDDSE